MPDYADVRLRPLAVEDAEVMATVLSHPDLYRFTGGEPPTAADLLRRYTAQVRGGPADGSEEWLNRIVLVGPGVEPAGYVQATITDDGATAEIAWVIGWAWQGRGYARRAAELLRDELVLRGVRTLIAHVHPDHRASARIAERLGLVRTDVAVDGEIRWAGAVGGRA
ncbi:GNAT family N-acetyltransferase [Georgenia sp. Z1491]|uniref:GNAT family N-acetyltransferase n=1 Tax=Georgenia sp. Z1491 TaxID=3416707 RepID=UPI003CEAC6AD